MPDQLLDRILAEIRERLDASRAAYEESQRLEAALSALGSGRAPEPSRPRARSRRAPRSRARSSARAPHGENLRRIRALVAERPGATAGEIAAATGIARPTVASTLGKLARAGELEKTTLPSRGVGYRPAASTPADATPVTATTPELPDVDAPPADREPAAEDPGSPGAATANGD